MPYFRASDSLVLPTETRLVQAVHNVIADAVQQATISLVSNPGEYFPDFGKAKVTVIYFGITDGICTVELGIAIPFRMKVVRRFNATAHFRIDANGDIEELSGRQGLKVIRIDDVPIAAETTAA